MKHIKSVTLLLCIALTLALTCIFESAKSEVYFSHDFEDDSLDSWTGVDDPLNTVISTTNPCHGNYSLRNAVPAGLINQWKGAYKNITGMVSSTVFLRAYVNYDTLPTDSGAEQWCLAITSQSSTQGIIYGGIKNNGSGVYFALYYWDSSTVKTYYTNITASADQWYCLEIATHIGAGDGWSAIIVNGTAFNVTSINNTGRLPNYARAGFSYSDASSASTTARVYVDDLVLADSYIGEISEPTPTEEVTYTATISATNDRVMVGETMFFTLNVQASNGTTIEDFLANITKNDVLFLTNLNKTTFTDTISTAGGYYYNVSNLLVADQEVNYTTSVFLGTWLNIERTGGSSSSTIDNTSTPEPSLTPIPSPSPINGQETQPSLFNDQNNFIFLIALLIVALIVMVIVDHKNNKAKKPKPIAEFELPKFPKF